MTFDLPQPSKIAESLRLSEGRPPSLVPPEMSSESKVGAPNPLTSVTDQHGQITFPSIYTNQQVADASPATGKAPAQTPPDMHDYTVKAGDNLWTIAKRSLQNGNRHARIDGEDIWTRMREIVDANKTEHPQMRPNPYFIWKGEHLLIPGAPEKAAPAQVRPADATPPSGGRSGKHAGGHGNGHTSDYTGPAPAPTPDGKHLATALKDQATHQAHRIGTVGDCARGPRQTFEKFGIKLRPMSAVAQGRLLEKSGLFDRVPASEVQPGDYGYRHWSARTIKRRGLGDLGDSFIVTNCNQRRMQAANDHMFTVPPGGGYYAPGIVFLRPNAKFQAAVEHFKKTGEYTRL